MSDEGVRLVTRAALILLMIIAAAFFKVLVGPGKKRGQVMLAGTLGGAWSGVLLSYPIHQWFGVEVSAISTCVGMVLGWAVAWIWARRFPRESY